VAKGKGKVKLSQMEEILKSIVETCSAPVNFMYIFIMAKLKINSREPARCTKETINRPSGYASYEVYPKVSGLSH
jgi:hypothetical protein